jgi:hypothetical protein
MEPDFTVSLRVTPLPALGGDGCLFRRSHYQPQQENPGLNRASCLVSIFPDLSAEGEDE